ncbi:MAG: hypothetical protein JW956_01280 [Calditrichaceae bacterium]|nr:hypothetical protein [Calditrichaceae bacterium]
MKLTKLVGLCLLLVGFTQAGIMNGPGNPHLSKGDIIVGARLALIDAYDAPVGFIINGEFGLMEGFLSIPHFPTSLGIGASLAYSGYTQTYYYGEYSYSNFEIMTHGVYHVKLIKKIPMDTYIALSLGFNIENNDLDVGIGGDPPDRNGGFRLGTSVGVRYYFTNNLAAVGELGFGMGLLRLGMDFKF